SALFSRANRSRARSAVHGAVPAAGTGRSPPAGPLYDGRPRAGPPGHCRMKDLSMPAADLTDETDLTHALPDEASPATEADRAPSPKDRARRAIGFWLAGSLAFSLVCGLLSLRNAFRSEYVIQD